MHIGPYNATNTLGVHVHVQLWMPSRLQNRSDGVGSHSYQYATHITRNPPLLTSYTLCWFITAILLSAGIALIACTSCFEGTDTSKSISSSSSSFSSHLPSSTTQQNDGASTITISSHAEASASNSHQTNIVITKQTTTPQAIVVPIPSPINPIEGVNSSELAACNAIRLHNNCCDAAVYNTFPKPIGCNTLYASHSQSSQYVSSSASSIIYNDIGKGEFIQCHPDKQVTVMCCKACIPSCMACSWGVPEHVYRLCYRRQPMGCHQKCKGSANAGHGLCPIASS